MNMVEAKHLKLPINYQFNQFVCFEFLIVGMDKIQNAYDASRKTRDAYQLFAGGAVGVACFGQGLELLLKAVCQARGVKEPKGNHKIFEMFQQIEGCERFRGNCKTLFELKGYESDMTEASETVEKLHKSWMIARYAALGKDTFEVPDPEKAKLLVFAILVTYFADFASETQRLLNLDIDFD